MAKKFNYKKMQKLAIDKIDYFGASFKVVVTNQTTPEQESWKPNRIEETVYDCKGVFIPPVNGIYFQHTRFGSNTWTNEDLGETKKACMIAPFKIDGKFIELTDVIAVIDTDGVRYSVTFCDTFKPANDILFYAYGLGR